MTINYNKRKKSLFKAKSKYNNVKTTIDNILFDSKAESMRYLVLRQQQELEVIKNLRLQVTYNLDINGQRLAKYIADFVYELTSNDSTIVEDVKNPALETGSSSFPLKKKAMKIIHNINVKCIHPDKVLIF